MFIDYWEDERISPVSSVGSEQTVSTGKVGGSNPSQGAKQMNTNKKEKLQRKTIKDPTKICDECMNEWTYFTIKEEKLCDQCYEEKYVKTKVG